MKGKQISMGALTVLLLSAVAWTVALAAEPAKQPQTAAATPVIRLEQERLERASAQSLTEQSMTISPLAERISHQSGFADWQGADAVLLRTLYDPSGHETALLWQIEREGVATGYLVSTLDGQNVYEYSRKSAPSLPSAIAGQAVAQGHIYAGPGLHLVWLNGEQGLELYDLVRRQTLPGGELLGKLPALTPMPESAPLREQDLAAVASPADSALYAVGLFGAAKLHAQKAGFPSLAAYAGEEAGAEPAFVVYEAIPDRLKIVLQISRLVRHGDFAYAGLIDPFAEGEETVPVYVDSRFPVAAVPVSTPSAK